MATATLNPVADSCVWHDAENSSLSTLIAAAGNNIQTTYYSTFACGLETSPSTTNGLFRYLRRALYTFDTSSIPDGATITSATLTLRRSGGNNLLGNFDVCLVGATPASATAHVAADYATVGDTEFASRVTYNDWAYNTDHTFTLNSSGIAHINKTGYTTFALRTGWDVDGTFTGTWAADKWSEVHTYYSENGDYQPELYIEYATTNYVEIAGSIPATSSFTASTLQFIKAYASIQRKVGSGSGAFAVIATVDWEAGQFVDPDLLEVGTIYTYRVRKIQQFGIPGQYSDEKSLQFDDMGIRLLAGEVAATPTVVGVLATTSTSELVRIERKTGDGEFIYYDLVDWADTTYTDPGPFEHLQTYTYRIKKIVAGYTGNPSNEVTITYNQPSIVDLSAHISAESQTACQLTVPPIAIIERKVGSGSFSVLTYVPYEPALYTDPGPFEHNETYSYRILKRVAGSEGGYSNTVAITWLMPNYVEIDGEISFTTSLVATPTTYQIQSSAITATATLDALLSVTTPTNAAVVATSSLSAALSYILFIHTEFAAACSSEGLLTRYVSIIGTIRAKADVAAVPTNIIYLTEEIQAISTTQAALSKITPVFATLPISCIVPDALLRKTFGVECEIAATSAVPPARIGYSANRIVVTHISACDGASAEFYLHLQEVLSFIDTVEGGVAQTHLARIDTVAEVFSITSSVEGYIFSKHALELMIGEGAYFIQVTELPFEIEYSESDTEEETPI